jgi:RND family efflux transporter MFP subunit
MRRRCIAVLAGLLGALGLAGCQIEKPKPPPPPPPPVTVVHPATAPVGEFGEYNGWLDTIETVEVRARVKGILTGIHFTEGTEVTGPQRTLGFTLVPGKLLYEIDEREYAAAVNKSAADVDKAKADIVNWQAQIKLAEAELARADDAYKKGVAGKTDLDKAAANVDVAKAQHTAAIATARSTEEMLETAKIQLDYTKIRAEIGGRINRTLVTAGNLVGQTDATLLTTIVRVDELYIYFDAPEADLVAYQRTLATTPQPNPTSRQIPVEIAVATEEGYPHRGVIDFRENRVETSTGTVRIRGRIPNPPGPTGERLLYPGLYARVRVPSGEPRPRLVIPEDCLMTGQEGRFVFVVRTDGTVWRIPAPVPGVVHPSWVIVNPNPKPPDPNAPPKPPAPNRKTVKSMVAILAGLAPEDRVIVDGLQKVKPGAPASPEEWILKPPSASQSPVNGYQ